MFGKYAANWVHYSKMAILERALKHLNNIKPQIHGKSHRSEIFVNKAAEPR